MAVAGEITNPFNALVATMNPISNLGFNAGTAFVDFYGSLITSRRRLQISQPSQTLQDPAFWTLTTANGASVTDGGFYNFALGSNPAASLSLQSVQVAPTITGTFGMMSIEGLIFPSNTAPPANSRMTIGAMTPTDGPAFRWENGVFKLVIRAGGSETVFSPAQFNGAPNFVYDYTFAPFLSILFIKAGCQFFSGSTLLHTYFGPLGTIFDFPLRVEASNTGTTTGCAFSIPGWTLQHLGSLPEQTTYASLLTAGTTVLKHGAGRLKRCIITRAGNPGQSLTLYDNTAASGRVIAVISPDNVNQFDFDLDFTTGLTALILGAGTPSATLTFY